MQKLTLTFNPKYPFVNDVIKMFEHYSDVDNVAYKYDISTNAKPIVYLLEKQFNKKFDFWDYVERTKQYQITPNPNKAILCFSGGKDSVNVALKLKDKYDLTLYYIKGINRSYPNEIDYAQESAKALGLPLVIQEVKLSGHTSFLENPIKDQFIYACALNYGLEQGIVNYFFGNAEYDTALKSNFDRDFSDCIEMFELFTQWVSKDLKIAIHNYPVIDQFLDSIINIGKNKEIRDTVLSCLLPYRFQKSSHDFNSQKYGIDLPKNMCGSCWKCCVQYIIWADKGWIEYNKDFYIHCLDFLKSKSLQECKVKAKNHKEAYISFIGNELYEQSILKRELGQ